jgi:type II secretory pathway component PulK
MRLPILPVRSGSILVVVLFMMVVLSFVTLSFAYRAGLHRRLGANYAADRALEHQVRSMVAIAMARLAENANEWDHRWEPWHNHVALGMEDWMADWIDPSDGEPAEYVADYSVIDESSKLHVLYASSEALTQLGMSPAQVQSLFDWMDSDEDALPEGAESEYYLQRIPAIQAKNQPLQQLEELLVIRGFTVEEYAGEDLNHNQQLDPSENDGGVSLPLDNADGRLDLGWVDLLTCVTDGRINLNTAPIEVLALLPLSEGAADQIVAYRQFDGMSEGELEEHVFRNMADVAALQGLQETDLDVLAAVATFRSTYFRVFARAQHVPSQATLAVQVLIHMDGDKPKIVHWYREP